MSIHNPGTKTFNYSPLWLDSENFKLPKERRLINAWARSFYALDADVNRIVNQHSLLISGALEINLCKSRQINDLVKKQLEILNLPSIIESAIKEYFILGEVFLYSELDGSSGLWSQILIQNPDYVLVKKDHLGKYEYYLRPDEKLRELCKSSKKDEIDRLSKSIVDSINNGENIKLDPFNFTHMANLASPYELRGSSILMPVFEILSKPQKSKDDLAQIRAVLLDNTSFEIKSIGAQVLLSKYKKIAFSFENWINKKILSPIFKINSIKNKDYPEIRFNFNKLEQELAK